MANYEQGNPAGLMDKRKLGRPTATVTASVKATPANYVSLSAARTRLGVINAAYYTAARLDQMSLNDMQYAIAVNDDAAGL